MERINHATNIFLQRFASEQVEEDSANQVVQKIGLMGDAQAGRVVLDRELEQEVFTLPRTGLSNAQEGAEAARGYPLMTKRV